MNLCEAKTKLSELVDRATGGEEMVIAKPGKPKVPLMPVREKPGRMFGGWEGKRWVADDFDDPLPDDILDKLYNAPLDPTER